MKHLVCILIFFIFFSCGNTDKENLIKNSVPETLNSKEKKANKTGKLFIPENINNKTDKTVIFAIADIGTWEGDYISNKIYVLYETQNIKRISNLELPKIGKLFCTELIDYHKADSIKYNAFFNYLYNLTDLRYNNDFKTPDTLDVSGGSLYYIYINVEEPGFWISFEPESSVLIESIEKEFDKLFTN